MIFDTNFDNLLWYILKTDKQNRMVILDFIKGIPQEFTNEIKKSISKYRECQITKKEFRELRNAIKINDNTVYGFKLYENGTLHLMRVTTNKEGKAEKTCIDLKNLTGKPDFDNISLPIEYFGTFEKTTIERDPWNPDGYEKNSTTEYGMLKTLSGSYIIKHYMNDKKLQDKVKHVYLKRIPTNICVSDLERFKSKKLSK